MRVAFGLVSLFFPVAVIAQPVKLPRRLVTPSKVLIQRVDSIGNVTPLEVSPKVHWYFQNPDPVTSVQEGPCAQIEFQDNFLNGWAETKVVAHQDAQVKFTDGKISACLSRRNGSFTVRGMAEGKKLKANYVVDLPFDDPQVSLSPECVHLGLHASAKIKGDFLSLGVRCVAVADKDLPNLKELEFNLVSEAIPSGEMAFKKAGDSYTRSRRTEKLPANSNLSLTPVNAEGKELGLLYFEWAGVSESALKRNTAILTAIAPEPVIETVPTTRKLGYLNVFGGLSLVNHHVDYVSIDAARDFSGTQVHLFANGVLPTTYWHDLTFELEGRGDLLSTLPQALIAAGLVEKPVYHFAENTVLIGLGLSGIAMVGNQDYGINQGLNVAVRAKVSAPNGLWSGSFTFAPTLASSFSLNSYWMNLNGFYRTKYLEKKLLVGVDLSFLAVPPTASKSIENYSGRSLALLLGYQFGEKP